MQILLILTTFQVANMSQATEYHTDNAGTTGTTEYLFTSPNCSMCSTKKKSETPEQFSLV